ncbi:hypothetical protein [Lentibacillus amyloliquefaciens]|uniref:Uncharacterized protein n=1 Tax=Lentibacillus amyloliquefaciens TaxID=1472767 RepID=A0A0U4FAL4_9BACI|nr:hypothetical protein [Lentibacillus amyloliquefaciens]ALX47549.1 hypothetical protein AOX59_02370 [Lentibacillus amyloliquefaciens]
MNQEDKVTYGESNNKQTKRRQWATKIKRIFKMKQDDKTTSGKNKVKMLRQTLEILPFVQIHNDHILLKNGVMDILQIQTKNIHALNDTDLNVLLMNRTRFLRSYFRSYKEIILNFPANTEAQRTYWLKKREQTTSPIRLEYIDQKLLEFDFLERERSNREFFIFVYADDKQELTDRKNDAMQGMQQAFPLTELTRTKKEQILFLLNNQNTKL